MPQHTSDFTPEELQELELLNAVTPQQKSSLADTNPVQTNGWSDKEIEELNIIQNVQKGNIPVGIRTTEPEPGFFEMFAASFATGKDQIELSMWEKLDTDRENGVGLGSILPENLIQFGLEDNMADLERNRAILADRFEQKPLEFSDIVKDPESFFSNTLPELLGQSIPLAMTPLVTSIGGAAVGTAVAGPAGTLPGLLYGSILGLGMSRYTESLAESGEVYGTAIREGKTKEEAFSASEKAFKAQMAVGIKDIPELALGFLPVAAVGRTLAKVGLRATARILSKSALKSGFWARNGVRMAGIATLESAEEGVQFYINESVLNDIRDEKLRTDLSFSGLWDNEEFISAMKAGTIVSVFLGGGMRAISEGARLTSSQIEKMDPVTLAQAQEAAQQQQIFKNLARGKESEFTARIEIEGEKVDGIYSNMKEADLKARVKDSKAKAKKVVKEIEDSADIYYLLQRKPGIKDDNNFFLAYRSVKVVDFNKEERAEKGTTEREKFVIDAENDFYEDKLNRIYEGEDVHKGFNKEAETFFDSIKTGAIFKGTEFEVPVTPVVPPKVPTPEVVEKIIEKPTPELSVEEKETFVNQIDTDIKKIRKEVPDLKLIEEDDRTFKLAVTKVEESKKLKGVVPDVDIDLLKSVKTKIIDRELAKIEVPEVPTAQPVVPPVVPKVEKPKVVKPAIKVPPTPSVKKPEFKVEASIERAKRILEKPISKLEPILKEKKDVTDLSQKDIVALGFKDVANLKNAVNKNRRERDIKELDTAKPELFTIDKITAALKRRLEEARITKKKLEAKRPIPTKVAKPPTEKPAPEEVPEVEEESVFDKPLVLTARPESEEVEKRKVIANKIREGKVTGIKLDIFFGVPTAIWNKSLEIIAVEIEKGTAIGKAIQKAIEFIKGTNWWKTISKDQQKQFEKNYKGSMRKRTKPEEIRKATIKVDEKNKNEDLQERLFNAEVVDVIDEADEDRTTKRIERFRDMYTGITGLKESDARRLLPGLSRSIVNEIKSLEEVVDGEPVRKALEKISENDTDEGLLANHLLLEFSESQLISLVTTMGNMKVHPFVHFFKTKEGFIPVISNKSAEQKEILEELQVEVGAFMEALENSRTDIESTYRKSITEYNLARKPLEDKWLELKKKNQQNTKEARELKRKIIEFDLRFISLMTGQEWNDYLDTYVDSGKTYINEYVNNEKDRSGFDMSTGTFNPISKFLFKLQDFRFARTPAFKYSEFKKRTLTISRSQVLTLAQGKAAKSKFAFNDRFETVDGQGKDALIENSSLTNDAARIHELPEGNPFWDNNKIVQFFRKEGKEMQLFFIDGIKDPNAKEAREMKDVDNADLKFMRLAGFLKGDKFNKGEYLHYIERFGDKSTAVMASLPKHSLQQARTLYNEIKGTKGVPLTDNLKINDFAKDVKQFINDGLISANEIKQAGFASARELASAFIYNNVVNKHYSDLYFFGNPEIYKDYIADLVKRASSKISNGTSLLANIKGGVPKEINYVILNDSTAEIEIGGKKEVVEIPDGWMVYSDRFAEQLAVSMGEISAQGRLRAPQTYIPYMKMLYDKTDEKGNRDLIKQASTALHDKFVKNSPTLKKLKQYMEENDIDILTFESSAKTTPKSDTTQAKWDKKGNLVSVSKPKIKKMDTDYLFIQTEYRRDVEMEPKEVFRQIRRFFSLFDSSPEIQKLFNTIYEVEHEKMRKDMLEWTDEQWKSKVLKSIPDTPNYDYIKSLIRNTDTRDHPHIGALEQQIFLSNSIGRAVLEVKANANIYQAVPDVGFGLKPMRIIDDRTEKEITIENYEKLLSTEKENFTVQPAEALVPEDSGLVEGEEFFSVRAPSDGLHSMSMMEVKGFVPREMGNIIVMDVLSQKIAGEDNDGDFRFVFTSFKDSKGDAILFKEGSTDPKAMMNQVFNLVLGEYENPNNLKRIIDPIDNDAIQTIVDEFKLKEKVNKFVLKDQEKGYNNVKDSKIMVSVIARTIAIYLLLSRNGISFKEGISFPKIRKGKWTGEYDKLTSFEVTDDTLRDLFAVANQNIDAIKHQNTEAMNLTEATDSVFVGMVSMGVRLEDAINFFNTPIAKRYSEKFRESKRIAAPKTELEVFNDMAEEILPGSTTEEKGKELLFSKKVTNVALTKDVVNSTRPADQLKVLEYLRYLNTSFRAMSDINMVIHYSERSIKDYGQVYNLKKILDRINTDRSKLNLAGFKNQTVDYLMAARKNLDLSELYFKRNRTVGTTRSQNMIEFVEKMWADFRNTKFFELNKDQMGSLSRAMDQAAFADAYKDTKGKKVINNRVLSQYEEQQKERPENLFIKSLNVKDSTLQLKDSLKRTEDDAAFVSDMQKAFKDLPEEFINNLVLYNFYNFGFTISTKRGGFSKFFDFDTQNTVSNNISEVRKKWNKDGKINLRVLFSILRNNPSLVPNASFVSRQVPEMRLAGISSDKYPAAVKEPIKGGFRIYIRQDGNFYTAREGGFVEVRFSELGVYQPFVEKQKPSDEVKPDSAKFMLQRDAEKEELATSDPNTLENTIKRFKKILPEVEVVFITNWIHEGMPVLGAAVGNTIFIDSEKSVQSTYFHEMAHLYWDALPANDSTKVKLMKMFNTEEDAIQAIGRIGTEVSEEDLKGFPGMVKERFNKGRFLSLLKVLWRKIKKIFGIKDKDHHARIMAERIWNNTDNLTSGDFVGNELNFMAGELNKDPVKEMADKAKAFLDELKFDPSNLQHYEALFEHVPPEKYNDVKVETINRRLLEGEESEKLSFAHTIMKHQGRNPRIRRDKDGDFTVSERTGTYNIKPTDVFVYSDLVNDKFGEASDRFTLTDVTGLTNKKDKDLTSQEISEWNTETVRKNTEKASSKVRAIIQSYTNHFEDFNTLQITFDTIGSFQALNNMTDKAVEKLYRDTVAMDVVASEPYLQQLNTELTVRKVREYMVDEELSGDFDKSYQFGIIFLNDLYLNNKLTDIGKFKRLIFSKKDIDDKIIQFKNLILGRANVKSMERSREIVDDLQEIEEEIAKENGSLENILIEQPVTKRKRFKSLRDPKEFETLKVSEKKWLRTYQNAIQSLMPETDWSSNSAYEKNVLKLPVVESDFWELLARKNPETGKRMSLIEVVDSQAKTESPYDGVVIQTEIEGEKGRMELSQAKIRLDIDLKNGVIKRKKWKKKRKEYEEQAKKWFGLKYDANGNAIYDKNRLHVPLAGISFKQTDTVSKNMSSTITKYIDQLSYRSHMQPLVPFAEHFNTLYDKDGNEQVKKLLRYWDDHLFFKKRPESAFKDYPLVEQGILYAVGFTAWRFLGLNYLATIFNLSAGTSQNFIDMEFKYFIRGLKRVVTQPRKMANVVRRFRIVNTSIDAEQSLPKRYFGVLQKWSFMTITVAEYFNQGTMITGMMTDAQWNAYDVDGKIVSEDNALTDNDIYALTMQAQNTHGPYHPFFRRQLNYFAEGMALAQFKGWMPEQFFRQFGKEMVDDQGNVKKGIVTTAYDLSLHSGLNDVLTGKTKVDDWWASLKPIDKKNLARGLRQLIPVAFLIMWLLWIGDDEEDKSLVAGIRRAMGDVMFVYDVDNITFLLESPIPAAGAVIDFMKLLEDAIQGNVYLRNGRYGKEGEYKWVGKLPSLMPFNRVVKDIMAEANK